MFTALVGCCFTVWCGPSDDPLRTADLKQPVRVEADGEWIDTGKDIGYAGVTVQDWNGDGLFDLFVTAIRGNVRYFENTGSATEPAFAERDPPEAGGKALEFENW